MSMPIETSIWEILLEVIEHVRGPTPVAMPDGDYRPTNLPYISVSDVSVAPQRQFIEENQPYHREGVLALVLRTPVGDTFDYRNMKYEAGMIASRVNDSTRFWKHGVCIRIASAPSVETGYRDSGWWHQPVNIPWECFA